MSTDLRQRPVTDVEAAEDLILDVESAAEAEELIARINVAQELVRLQKLGEEQERRWKVVRLKAERRYGGMLGPASPNGRGARMSSAHPSSAAEATARKQARKVAAIPQDQFEEYIRSAKSPSRGGLLGKQPATWKHEPGSELENDEKVIAWVAKRVKAGRTRLQICADADLHANGWPREGERLGYTSYDRITAILKDRDARPTGRQRNWNGKSNGMRAREIRQNDLGKLNRLAMDINRLCRTLEDYQPEDYQPEEDSVWHIAAIYEDLVSLGEWVSRSLSATQGWLGDTDVRKKIEQLRDTHGRTPEEAETAKRLADLLERKLGARLETSLT